MSEAALLKSAQELQRELKAAEGQLLSMAKSLQKAQQALAELNLYAERLVADLKSFHILVKPLAERWRDTPAWHADNNNGVAFRDGEIHIRTGLLQDFYALTYAEPFSKWCEGNAERLEKDLQTISDLVCEYHGGLPDNDAVEGLRQIIRHVRELQRGQDLALKVTSKSTLVHLSETHENKPERT